MDELSKGGMGSLPNISAEVTRPTASLSGTVSSEMGGRANAVSDISFLASAYEIKLVPAAAGDVNRVR